MTDWQITLRDGLPEGDRALALAEVRHLFTGVVDQPNGSLAAESSKVPLETAARRLAFVQILRGPHNQDPSAPWSTPYQGRICAVPQMAMGELLTLSDDPPGPAQAQDWVRALASGETTAAQRKALARKRTSTPHVHGLHTYKAKFFPRMVRSRLQMALDQAPPGPQGPQLVLDPFSGSGTTVVEAASLGTDSIGVDIDPLSVAIARSKRSLMHVDSDTLKAEIERCLADRVREPGPYQLPPWMARKWNRHGHQEARLEIERTIAQWRDTLRACPDPHVRNVLMVCLSDALVRKFNVRMMGTGVGRFALEIRKRSLASLVESALKRAIKARSVIDAMDTTWGSSTGRIRLLRGDATALDLPDGTVSVVLTSPPYLPGSSGREAYLIGKSISLTALGLMTSEEIASTETDSVGSMKAAADSHHTVLPGAVHDLVNWLFQDDLRRIKAAPTLRYYRDLLKSLRETRRVLAPRGLALYVIGKASTFYRFKTREILYTVACDDIFRELALLADLEVIDQTDVRLEKKNRNARPRSLDDYYESVITLRRPA
jgi:SAM-dependent methyltransferase